MNESQPHEEERKNAVAAPEAAVADTVYPKVYLLPNLMTAGNLFCGFMAVLFMIQGKLDLEMGASVASVPWTERYEKSLLFIFAACVFDVLDGRLARFGGNESSFGREFDSLADVISFGFAPAILVFHIVLADFPNRLGWLIAFIYLVCGALRLARFNVMSSSGHSSSKDFTGFPIPAAAGVIASITLLMLSFYRDDKEIGNWKYALPALMFFLSFMMFSRVRYPSFKSVDWRTKRSLPHLLLIILLLFLVVIYKEWMLPFIFVSYLLYGFFRPFLSHRIRREIEEEDHH